MNLVAPLLCADGVTVQRIDDGIAAMSQTTEKAFETHVEETLLGQGGW